MSNTNFWRRALAVTALLLLGAGAALAQSQAGNLYGTAADDQGSPLPGVTVTLSGGGAPVVQVTNASGQFRFLGLSPGGYDLKAELEGFSPVEYPNIVINISRNTEINITMNAAVRDVITVTTESPLLDTKKISSGNTVAQTEMEKIPSARDPWAVLQSTPGVLTDRINVGGNESGQQSQYVGPGSGGDQAVWALDGMVVTDMSATGSSPGYYDFDAFEEMQVSTGGSDASLTTGGVTLNMVTKRGTNEWRGSGRYMFENDSMQSESGYSTSDLGKPGEWNRNRTQTAFKRGNRIDSIEDWGFELGGPIVKDKFWIWGSYAKPQIDLLTVSDFSDKTTLEDWNAKINGQLTAANSLTLFGWQSDKVKIGRNAGPTRPQETTWDQSKFGPAPTAYKVEDTHVFGPNFYLTGMYSKVNGGFQLIPEGGDKVFYLDGATGIWHNSFFEYQILRPQEQFKVDTSTFFNAGSMSHELKIGAGYRTALQDSTSEVKGGAYGIDFTGLGGEQGWIVARDGQIDVETQYTNLFAQDTFSVGNMTFNVGLRYDKQTGDNLKSTVAAGRLAPALLPAVTYPGQPAGFDWSDIVPRLGLTYALGAERKTLLRASYSQFADQLSTGNAGWLHPLGVYSYLYAYDYTGNARPGVFPGIGALDVLATSPNYNPVTKGYLQSYAVDPDLSAPTTDELLLSLEHAFMPEFVMGVNFTMRKISNMLESELLVFDGDPYSTANLTRTGRAHQRSDYVLVETLTGVLPNGKSYTVPVYDLRSGVNTRGGSLLRNGDREQDYQGMSVSFTKRLSNRWMARGNFAWNDWTWNIPSSEQQDPVNPIAGGNKDGEIVMQGSGTGSGSKGSVYLNAGWSYSVNGMYQIAPDRPWGFNVAASVAGREGYPIRYANLYTRKAANFGRTSVSLVDDADDLRYDDIQTVDLRVEKEFNFSDFGLTVGVDVFNALNEGTVMQREGRLFNDGATAARSARTTGSFITEVLSPRVYRLGARFSFR